MNFLLSENHQMLSDTLRRFLAETYDINERNRQAFTAPYHSVPTWQSLADLGIIGAFVSEEQGGFGGTAGDVSVVFEELGRSLCAEPVLGALLGLQLLAQFGQQDLVENIVSGRERCALAFAEPRVACDLSEIGAFAQQDGEMWRLNGRKSAAYGAPGAEHLLIVARTDVGVGLFLTKAPALIASAMIDGGGIADIDMDNLSAVCLSPDCQQAIEDALDLGRIALCAEAVGAMTKLVELTVDYLKDRKQFGRPLASFQALQHRVVDMMVELEQSRSITISAVAAYGTPDQSNRVSMAKNLIGRVGTKIAEETIQLHGGIGMTWEFSVSHFAKRLIMIDHQLGDRNDHVLRLIEQASTADAA